MAKSLVACQNNNTICRVWNSKPYALSLRKGTKLAKIENINTIASTERFNELSEPVVKSHVELHKSKVELDAFYKSYGFKINPDLTETQRYKLLQLLYNYKDVFARDFSETQECRAAPMPVSYTHLTLPTIYSV